MIDLEPILKLEALSWRVRRDSDYRRTEIANLRGYAFQTGKLISAVRSPLASKEKQHRGAWQRKIYRNAILVR